MVKALRSAQIYANWLKCIDSTLKHFSFWNGVALTIQITLFTRFYSYHNTSLVNFILNTYLVNIIALLHNQKNILGKYQSCLIKTHKSSDSYYLVVETKLPLIKSYAQFSFIQASSLGSECTILPKKINIIGKWKRPQHNGAWKMAPLWEQNLSSDCGGSIYVFFILLRVMLYLPRDS